MKHVIPQIARTFTSLFQWVQKLQWVVLFVLLSSCSKQTSSCRLYSERITSQHDCPVIPNIKTQQNTDIPTYPWTTSKTPIITHYAFHCRGSGQTLSTNEQLFFDCEGIHHGFNRDFFIHPRLVSLAQWLQTIVPIQIKEGFSCPQHFNFLQQSGASPSPKLLTGHAIVLTTSELDIHNKLLSMLPSFYKNNTLYSLAVKYVDHDILITNHEFCMTLAQNNTETILTIEIT